MRFLSSIFVLVLSLSLTAKAGFNDDCKFAYRNGAVSLIQGIENFRDNRASGAGLGLSVLQTDSAVKAIRMACYFTENPANGSCVRSYRNLYLSLRKRTNLIALMLGNQITVDYSILDLAHDNAVLKLTDLACGY